VIADRQGPAWKPERAGIGEQVYRVGALLNDPPRFIDVPCCGVDSASWRSVVARAVSTSAVSGTGGHAGAAPAPAGNSPGLFRCRLPG
jgi:hypothetical protein